MTNSKIKITGIFEIEIELPSCMSFSMSGNVAPPEPATETSPATKPTPSQLRQSVPQSEVYGQGLNGRIAAKVADFIKAAGPQGVTRHQITRKFGQIKNAPQRAAILKMLPELIYRKSYDKKPKGSLGRGAERWTYFYSDTRA